MKLSICCITYNHGPFIATTLDNFLNQKVNFDYEIIIGEDCSKDNTREVLLKYQAAYPDKIKLLLHQENVGMINNFMSVLNAATGQYIAICEGDDYWIDPNKLQTQVDFLDANPDFTLTCHSIYNLLPNGIQEKNQFTPAVDMEVDEAYIAKSSFINTLSVVLRNKEKLYFPDWLHQSPVADYPFFLLHISAGKVKYFSKTMAVYRIHQGGAWTSLKEIDALKAYLFVLDNLLNEDLGAQARKNLNERRRKMLDKIISYLLYTRNTIVFHEIINRYSEAFPELKSLAAKKTLMLKAMYFKEYFVHYIKPSIKGGQFIRALLKK